MLRTMKTVALTSLIMSTLTLSSCVNEPSHILSFKAPIVTSQFNLANQRQAVLNVRTCDQRIQSEISSYVRDGKIFKLFASPDVVQLFQQIFQQDLNSKGFRLGTPSNANTNILINVKDFYAKVEQGTLFYKVSSKIQLEVQVQGAKGNFTKNIGGTRTYEGALSAGNDEIQKVLRGNLNDVANAVYQDRQIGEAIQKYSN